MKCVTKTPPRWKKLLACIHMEQSKKSNNKNATGCLIVNIYSRLSSFNASNTFPSCCTGCKCIVCDSCALLKNVNVSGLTFCFVGCVIVFLLCSCFFKSRTNQKQIHSCIPSLHMSCVFFILGCKMHSHAWPLLVGVSVVYQWTSQPLYHTLTLGPS